MTLFLILIMNSLVMGAPLDEGLKDDTYIVLDYSGSWSQVASAVALAGNYSQTTDITASVSFDVYSEGFTVYFIYEATGSSMEVCIDATCSTVSTVGATARGVAEFTGLSEGLKTVTISKVVDDGLTISLDAVYVHPQEDVSPTPSPNLVYTDFDYEGTTYTGLINLSLSSGEIVIVLLLGVIVLTQFARFVLEVRR